MLSGYRFVIPAIERGLTITILNIVQTRGDKHAHLKINVNCGDVLQRLKSSDNDSLILCEFLVCSCLFLFYLRKPWSVYSVGGDVQRDPSRRPLSQRGHLKSPEMSPSVFKSIKIPKFLQGLNGADLSKPQQ